MLENNLEDYSWVSINKMSVENLDKILRNILIDRYATGGVESANKSIREIIGDASFWNKFVLYKGKWRLGSINESCLEDKELEFVHMFLDSTILNKWQEICMKGLEKLLDEYVEEGHPTTLFGVITLTERYLQTIPDSQVKVLMYQMWKHLSGVEVIDSNVNSN